MKASHILLILGTTGLFTLLSCKQGNQAARNDAATAKEEIVGGVTKEEIDSVIRSLPALPDVVKLINASGAPYLPGMTAEDIHPGNLLFRADKARTIGAIGFDMVYTKIYSQVESFHKLLLLYEALVRDLGYEELSAYLTAFRKEYDLKKGNPSQVDSLARELRIRGSQLIYKLGSPKDLTLVLTGAVSKSVKVTASLALHAQNSEPLAAILRTQHQAVAEVCRILAQTPGDPDLKKYYDKLIPVGQLLQPELPLSVKTIQEIEKLTTEIVQ